MNRYRQVFLGFLIAVGLFAGFQGYQFFTAFALMRQQHAVMYNFLAEPIAKNDKGEAITRASVLEAVAKRVADASTVPPSVPEDKRTP